ncbi:hypothetical protein O3G_MSEX013797 [Manduca sexta]|uniref:C2H2-type domain-containing protein n=2 Tax=Manduca sexta TaxID=7130 RepID=A0A922CZV6_MANSE|nr:hypothetical protein O3G_MSEX013797 [Manduca sexta]
MRIKVKQAVTDDRYKCDMCDTEWLTETDVEIHRKKAHINKLLLMIKSKDYNICLTCVRDQGTPEGLLRHIKTEHLLTSPTAHRIEREIFICDHCNHIFFNKMMLIAHIQYIHGTKISKNNYISCPKCYKRKNVKKLWFHFAVHQMNMISTCQICFVDCRNTRRLKEHMRTHTGYYYCETCNFTTNKDKYFENHVLKHKHRNAFPRNVEPRKYFVPGPFLGLWKYKRETGIKGLQIHDVFICVLCREICASKGDMRSHIFVDHAPETIAKKKLLCSCGEEFFNTVLLKHHVFKMKGDHKIVENVDDSDFGRLLAEEKNNAEENVQNDFINNYEIVLDDTSDSAEIVPLEDFAEESGNAYDIPD